MVSEKLMARDLMTRCVKTVQSGSSLAQALSLMDKGGYSQLPVMDRLTPVAMLTETDVRRAFMLGRQERPVGELASPLPRLLTPSARLAEVILALQQQDSLLVVSPKNRLLGIITYWDIVVLARPFLMVAEVELTLRLVVAAAYRRVHGPDWWAQVPRDLRERAEEEHRQDDDGEPTPEHMLVHTGFWALIEMYRAVEPEMNEAQYRQLHRVRELRNRIAHYYSMSKTEQIEVLTRCFAVGDWLNAQLPAEGGG